MAVRVTNRIEKLSTGSTLTPQFLYQSRSIGIVWMIEGSLGVKLPTIWTDEKQSRAEAERRGRLEEKE